MDIASRIGLSPSIYWIAFGVVALVFIIQSAIIVYHWRAYGPPDMGSKSMFLVFFGMSALLFALAAAAGFSLLFT